MEAILARRSIRRFTGRDVSPEHEQVLIDAAFAAPSASNARTWHVICVRDPETRRRLKALSPYVWMLDEAPLVIAVLGRESDNAWWIEDCSAATENVLVAAAALGLGAVWCGMREDPVAVAGYERACLDVLGAPRDEWRALALIGVGHPAEEKEPRTQREEDKLSYERFGRRSRQEEG